MGHMNDVLNSLICRLLNFETIFSIQLLRSQTIKFNWSLLCILQFYKTNTGMIHKTMPWRSFSYMVPKDCSPRCVILRHVKSLDHRQWCAGAGSHVPFVKYIYLFRTHCSQGKINKINILF